MILQAVSVLLNKSTSIIILPLDQIGLEQTQYIERIGGRPCFVNSDTISDTLLKDIGRVKYTHLLLSPELAVSERLRHIILEPNFISRLALVIVDEAHLVSQWGANFRTDYSRLSLLRSRLGPEIPWFACSATLDPTTLRELIQGIGLDETVKIQRTSIDRPELLIRTGIIPRNTRNKFSALRFLFDPVERPLDSSTVQPSNIPKTIVFFDRKRELHTAHKNLLMYLETHERFQYSRKKALEVVQVFTRETYQKDKDFVISELQKPGHQSNIRVVLATEALGIGVNLPDIRRSVQYGIPKGLLPSVLWQRGGRAAWDGQDGEIILLIDEWAKGKRVALPSKKQVVIGSSELDDIPQDPSDKGPNDENGLQERVIGSEAERRGRLPDFWFSMVNGDHCIRNLILKHFAEPGIQCSTTNPRCCSKCSKNYKLGKLDRAEHYIYNERGNRYGKIQKAINDDLINWANDQLNTVYPNTIFEPTANCFLSETRRIHLARNAHKILDLHDLQKMVGDWVRFNTYGQELFRVLRTSWSKHHRLPTSRQKWRHQAQAISNDEKVLIPSPSTSQPLPAAEQTPTHGSSQFLIFESLPQTPPVFPTPDLSYSTQPSTEKTTQEPPTPSSPQLLVNTRKRRPLSSISSNTIRIQRPRRH